MKVPRKKAGIGDVDVTSFSDLAFLLIVFFVLTTTLIPPTGAKLSIPSSTSDPEQKPDDDPPTINLSQEHVLLNEEEMTIDELRKALFRMKLADKEEEKRSVVLESAVDVTFDRYFKVVTAVSKAGGVLALVERVEEGEEE